MERGSSKHSPRVDEQLDQEVEGMMTAERPTRAEEWKEAEPAGEDQADPGRLEVPDEYQPAVPDGMTPEGVELRSQLAMALPRAAFPADKAGLMAHLEGGNAPDRIRQLVRQLPSGETYHQVGEVVRALGVHEESHRS